MRVLHVVPTGSRRGAEVFSGDLANQLDHRGIDQRVVVLRADGSPLVRYPCPVSILPRGSRIAVLNIDATTARSLSTAIRASCPDVIQAHGGESMNYVLAATRGSRRPPLVYRRIGAAASWMRSGVRRRAYASLMRRPEMIVAVAESLRTETIDLFGVRPERIVTIPNAVDATRVAPTRSRSDVLDEFGIAPDAVVLLSLGSLSWEKDPLVLLEVATRVLGDVSDAVLLMAGDGPLRGELEATVSGSEVRDRIRILGSRSDVGDILGASDLMVFTSRDDGMEGMPASLIESGLAGLPVVAYDVAGVREVVEDGIGGRVVLHGDRAALEAAVRELAGDPALRQRLGSSAMKHCGQHFEIGHIADRYADVYRAVADAA